MTQLSYRPNDYEIFLGLDVDKNSFSYTVQDHFQKLKSKKMPSDPEYLYNYIRNHYDPSKVICAYEAGPTGFHLHDYLSQRSIKCLVTAPASIPTAQNDKVKTNRIDSVKIADHLMSGKLKPIRIPEGPYRELRDLIKIRENYARDRKVARQRIKAFLLYSNLYSIMKDADANWSAHYIEQLKNLECSFAARHRLDMLIEDLEHARRKLLAIHRTLKSFCRENDEIREYMDYLQSIPGIGFTIAVMLLGKTGDPKYLKNQRELAAFIGLNPREKSSGDSINRGPITHMGDKTLRFLLIEAAWVAVRKDTELGQFYHRIRSRNHPKAASKIAITAVARKMTQIIYRVLTDKRNYVKH